MTGELGGTIGVEGASGYTLYKLDTIFLAKGETISQGDLEVLEYDNLDSSFIDCPIIVRVESADTGITDIWLVVNVEYEDNYDYGYTLELLKSIIIIGEGNAQLVDYDSVEFGDISLLRVRYHFETPAAGFEIKLEDTELTD